MLAEPLISRHMRQRFQRHMHLHSLPCAAHLRPEADRRYLLYVHIPFCEHLCPFCSFHRVRLGVDEAQRYFTALRREIRGHAERGFQFSEVYIGGGTPTVLPEELARTLAMLRDLFPLEQISVETNPNHLNAQVLPLLEAEGIDRLSVGIQSFDDSLLKNMDRYEAYGSGAQHIERLSHAQGIFETLNVDMIFNLPHQSPDSLERDIHLLKEIGVDQASFYPLMNSSTAERAMTRHMGRLSYRNEKPFYEAIRSGMQPGYRPASAWCFSRKEGMIDEYLIKEDEVIGAGSGTFSYLDGTLYSNTFSINHYIEQLDRGQSPVAAARQLSRREQIRYALLMRLFGLSMDKVAMRERYGPRVFRELWMELSFLKAMGAIQEDGERYRLTERGMYPWVIMMREFFIGVNNFRDEMRAHIREEWDMTPCPAED